MRKAVKIYSLPFTQALHMCTHPFILRQKVPKGGSCKDAWSSSESSILFRTAKTGKGVLKLEMH